MSKQHPNLLKVTLEILQFHNNQARMRLMSSIDDSVFSSKTFKDLKDVKIAEQDLIRNFIQYLFTDNVDSQKTFSVPLMFTVKHRVPQAYAFLEITVAFTDIPGELVCQSEQLGSFTINFFRDSENFVEHIANVCVYLLTEVNSRVCQLTLKKNYKSNK